MQKIYSTLLLIALTLIGFKSSAQCSGCTTNITGLDVGSHIVGAGQTLCVASTGTMTGLITVSAGGTLCNQGKIQSTNLWVAGGTLKNYGTIDTYSVLVSAAGTFTNYANAYIDSLLIINPNSSYVNNGTQVSTAFATADNATSLNANSITTYDMWDSIGVVTNNGFITINHNFGNAYGSSFTNNSTIAVSYSMANMYSSTTNNNGNITVNSDFSNSYNSNFTNNGNLTFNQDFGNYETAVFLNNNYMKVTRDYYNATSSNFTTKCMIDVNRDWYNSANVYGPTTSCGGFNVTGITLNSGTIGSGSTHIDICDAGHPTFGIDGPGGSINGTTTFCTCNNNCSMVSVGIKEAVKMSNVMINTIYPNPAKDILTIKLNNPDAENLMIEVRDMMGRTIFTKSIKVSIGENETEINVSNLAQGTYILNITDSHQLQSKQLFNVTK
jgi:hypothetical protein